MTSSSSLQSTSSFTSSSSSSSSQSYIKWYQIHAPIEPFHWQWFLSIRGGEYVHLYLWILKDLSWTQDWYYMGNITASLAVMWAFHMLINSMRNCNRNEIITGTSQLLWLVANFWWMTGELHDWQFRKDSRESLWYPEHTIECGMILQASLGFMLIYFIIIKPWQVLEPSDHAVELYNETGLPPRCTCMFKTWREYENMHIFWWLGKDYAWNALNLPIWIVFVVPTVLIAGDFVHTSRNTRKLAIDHMHYRAQFMWVMGNFVWALGELIDPQHDYPFSLFARDPLARRTLRWYSSWVLIAAFIPITLLYVVWIPNPLSRVFGYFDSEQACNVVVAMSEVSAGPSERISIRYASVSGNDLPFDTVATKAKATTDYGSTLEIA